MLPTDENLEPEDDICPYDHIRLVMRPIRHYFDGHVNRLEGMAHFLAAIGIRRDISSTVRDVSCSKCHRIWSKTTHLGGGASYWLKSGSRKPSNYVVYANNTHSVSVISNSSAATDYQIADDPWQSVRALWRQRTRMLDMNESEERRRPVEREIIDRTLKETRKLIDTLKSTPPDPEKLGRLITNARIELRDIPTEYADEDQNAEIWCQKGDVTELDMIHFGRISRDTGDKAFFGTMCYEQAVKASKMGSGKDLARYQERLATFRKRWPIA